MKVNKNTRLCGKKDKWFLCGLMHSNCCSESDFFFASDDFVVRLCNASAQKKLMKRVFSLRGSVVQERGSSTDAVGLNAF